jgi:hypothetical protein
LCRLTSVNSWSFLWALSPVLSVADGSLTLLKLAWPAMLVGCQAFGPCVLQLVSTPAVVSSLPWGFFGFGEGAWTLVQEHRAVS